MAHGDSTNNRRVVPKKNPMGNDSLRSYAAAIMTTLKRDKAKAKEPKKAGKGVKKAF